MEACNRSQKGVRRIKGPLFAVDVRVDEGGREEGERRRTREERREGEGREGRDGGGGERRAGEGRRERGGGREREARRRTACVLFFTEAQAQGGNVIICHRVKMECAALQPSAPRGREGK
jgi:hypothetical protein